MQTIDWEYVRQWLPQRPAESDKNTYGRVLAICGSRDYIGAPYFAAQAAVRTGSGIVTLALPRSIYPIVAQKLNEPTFLPQEEDEQGHICTLPSLERRAAVLIGPGLGLGDSVTKLVEAVITQANCPIIIDADGINALAGHIDIVERAKYPVVLTPHRHEFGRICDVEQTQNREETARSFAQKHHCVLLLKGHQSIIAAPDGTVLYNIEGNPGMAKGGSGDVLSGMILSLLGQKLPPLPAAACGAYLHSKAGNLCANRIGEYGMTPTDMLSCIPEVLKPLNSKEW